MIYQVFCTFDLKNATSTDYNNAYADLEKIGLKKVVAGTTREVVIPTTSVIGTYNGTDTVRVRDYVLQQIQDAFTARRFKSEIFLIVGENGTWISSTT